MFCISNGNDRSSFTYKNCVVSRNRYSNGQIKHLLLSHNNKQEITRRNVTKIELSLKLRIAQTFICIVIRGETRWAVCLEAAPRGQLRLPTWAFAPSLRLWRRIWWAAGSSRFPKIQKPGKSQAEPCTRRGSACTCRRQQTSCD